MSRILLTCFSMTSSDYMLDMLDDSFDKLRLDDDKAVNATLLCGALDNGYDYVFCLGQRPLIKDKVHIEARGKLGGVSLDTSMDIEALRQCCEECGLMALISHNAGTSFCNDVYFHGLKHISEERLAVQLAFIHVPFAKNISDMRDMAQRLQAAIERFTSLQ